MAKLSSGEEKTRAGVVGMRNTEFVTDGNNGCYGNLSSNAKFLVQSSSSVAMAKCQHTRAHTHIRAHAER